MKAKIVTAAAIAAAVFNVSHARADSIVLYGNVQQPPKAWLDGKLRKDLPSKRRWRCSSAQATTLR